MLEKFTVCSSVIQSDKFLSLTKSAQALYFQLMAECDVCGIVVDFKRCVRSADASEEDLNLLIKSGFVENIGSFIRICHWVDHTWEGKNNV